MYFRCLESAAQKSTVRFLAFSLMLALSVTSCGMGEQVSPLRVCSDPNNLPFSNVRGEGFENRIAEIVANTMRRPLEYTWWAQRRGFVRNTLNSGICDVVMGVPTNFDLTLTTSPYYTSTYVFVSRADEKLRIDSFDDPVLRRLVIGVPLLAEDYSNTPAAVVLGRRGIIGNVRGFPVYGDYSQPNPPARIIEAVANRSIDIAIVWGPLAGYFGPRQAVPIELKPTPKTDLAVIPFVYGISMGVRKDDRVLRDELERVMVRIKESVDTILDQYGVPRIPQDGTIRSAKK